MNHEGLSRRNFLRNTAAGSGGAALGSLAITGSASAEAPSPAPPWPVTEASYPLTEPAGNAIQTRLKLVAYRADFSDSVLGKLQAYAPNLEIKNCQDKGEFQREIVDANIIFGGPSREEFQTAKELRWVQYSAAGVNELLYPEFVESPVVLTNGQRMFSPTISESVIGMLILLTRRLHDYARLDQERKWSPLPNLHEVSGMTMGIVGMGGIGTDTAYRAHYGFHMKILATDPKPLPKPAFVAELHSPEWLPKMVPQVDVLLSAAPHTPITQKMFNDEIFRLMKPTAYFLNVSRGTLVDTPALVSALQEKRIAGAALDVTDPEPLPSDHPLWTAGNIFISPHTCAAGKVSADNVMGVFCENVRRYVAGLPLLNVVDKRRGY